MADTDIKVAVLAGNPNVGKSTIFNTLTGMHQHTGNWTGKTVSVASGEYISGDKKLKVVDIPGTYSLFAHSAEEEVARDFICFESPDVTAVVCDATCLERNLNLVLQTMEMCDNTVVCVNLIDEAKRKGVTVDVNKISEMLGVPVIATTAKSKQSIRKFGALLVDKAYKKRVGKGFKISYPDCVEKAISKIEPTVRRFVKAPLNTRWLSLRLLDADRSFFEGLESFLGEDITLKPEMFSAVNNACKVLEENGIDKEKLKDTVVTSIMEAARYIAENCVTYKKDKYSSFDRRLDKIFTGRTTGIPVMILLLLITFWITITGANYPSELLSRFLFFIEDKLALLLASLSAPDWLINSTVHGMYRVLAWVVSVMLPPMAIFFPLFTLLEDSGYLPRIAFNLDSPFRRCNACGKQALTMCMGFGCNAAGVVGCRIIDSPRERLLAVLTNAFVPCNGRFPAIISVITMFFVGFAGGVFSSVMSALLLTAAIILGVAATFTATYILSKTVLKGIPSSFTLELPPYRKPQIGKVIARSVTDRTAFVLGRAVTVAAPAGLIIWLMANISISGNSILNICSDFLDAPARLMGLDGVLLISFILGFPANEIVVPVAVMAYTSSGILSDVTGTAALKTLLVSNGWTPVTAICFIVFSLMHWPCSTTLLTVKKETGSLKWTAAAAILPTLFGAVICIIINLVSKLFI